MLEKYPGSRALNAGRGVLMKKDLSVLIASVVIATSVGATGFHRMLSERHFIWTPQVFEVASEVIFVPLTAMKVDKDYGTIQAGKYADIIAVKGDVLRYIDLLQRVDVVVKHGKRYR